MNETWLVLDVDGTLLNPKGILEETLAEFLQDLKGKAEVVLMTGRPPRNLDPILRRLGLHSPNVAYNGQLILDGKDNPLLEKRFPIRVMKEVLYRLGGRVPLIHMEGSNWVYREGEDAPLELYFPKEGMRFLSKGDTIPEEDPWVFLFATTDVSIPAEITSFLENCSYPFLGLRSWNGLPYHEIYRKDADKGTAFRALMERIPHRPSRIIGVGDSTNDEAFLSLVDEPYLMRNAKNESLRKKFPLTRKGNGDGGLLDLLTGLGL